MDKQELIDKAVERFQGKWPSVEWDESKTNRHCLVVLKKTIDDLDGDDMEANPDNYPGAIRAGGTGYNPEYCEFICLKNDYLNRARELGWINGCKWGVEYPTNGKKPDLPDDLLVQFKHKRWEWNSDADGVISCKVKHWDWSKSCALRIIDQRYRPVEQTASEPADTDEVIYVTESKGVEWFDYQAHKTIDPAPLGSKVIVDCFDKGWKDGVVIGVFERWNRINIDGILLETVDLFRIKPKDHATRAKELEKKRVVDAALDAMDRFDSLTYRLVNELYDKGLLKLPEDK